MRLTGVATRSTGLQDNLAWLDYMGEIEVQGFESLTREPYLGGLLFYRVITRSVMTNQPTEERFFQSPDAGTVHDLGPRTMPEPTPDDGHPRTPHDRNRSRVPSPDLGIPKRSARLLKTPLSWPYRLSSLALAAGRTP